MGLDVLNPVHLKKINETGTVGVITEDEFDPDRHHSVSSNYWEIVDTDSYYELTSTNSGEGYKDRKGVFVDDKFYIFGGASSADIEVADLRIYTVTDSNTGAGSWVAGPGGGAARKECAIDTDGSALYIFAGGTDGSGPQNNMQKYTISSATWNSNISIGARPLACTRHDVAYYDGYVYTMDGWYGEIQVPHDQLWRFDTSTNIWEQLTPAGLRLINFKLQAWDGKLYVFGGMTWSSSTSWVLNDYIYTYDIANDSWSNTNIRFPQMGSETGSYIFDNKAYIHKGGTTIDGNQYNSIVVYDYVKKYVSYRFAGGRVHAECAIGGHPITGDMYMYGRPYTTIFDMWKRNGNTLAIRKV